MVEEVVPQGLSVLLSLKSVTEGLKKKNKQKKVNLQDALNKCIRQ